MDILKKINKYVIETTVCADIEQNPTKGNVDVLGYSTRRKKRKNKLTGEYYVNEGQIIELKIQFLSDKAVNCLRKILEKFKDRGLSISLAADGAKIYTPEQLSKEVVEFINKNEKHLKVE